MVSPSDPCVPVIGYYERRTEESIESSITPYDGSVPRGTVQAYFGRVAEVPFRDVSCTVAYVRSLTRQEAWDAEGLEAWCDEANHAAKVGWYYDRVIGERGRPTRRLPPGWYSDIDGETPAQGFDASNAPANPPADWEPHGGIQVIAFVKDPTVSYPTPVVRVLYCTV